MSWGGPDGEALRDRAIVELSLTRIPSYRLKEIVEQIRHEDKGNRLRYLVAQLDATFTAIEQVLTR